MAEFNRNNTQGDARNVERQVGGASENSLRTDAQMDLKSINSMSNSRGDASSTLPKLELFDSNQKPSGAEKQDSGDKKSNPQQPPSGGDGGPRRPEPQQPKTNGGEKPDIPPPAKPGSDTPPGGTKPPAESQPQSKSIEASGTRGNMFSSGSASSDQVFDDQDGIIGRN